MDEDWLRIFEAKALAEALTEAGHSVSERTAQRWKKKETRPKPQDVRAIRELVGAIAPDAKKKNAPAEAGADEIVNLWLERWHDAPEPHWAQRLTQQIIATIETDREAAILSLARELGGSTYEQLREHLRRLRAESSQEATDQ